MPISALYCITIYHHKMQQLKTAMTDYRSSLFGSAGVTGSKSSAPHRVLSEFTYGCIYLGRRFSWVRNFYEGTFLTPRPLCKLSLSPWVVDLGFQEAKAEALGLF